MILLEKETVKMLQCYKLQFDKDLRPQRLKRYKVKTMLMLENLWIKIKKR